MIPNRVDWDRMTKLLSKYTSAPSVRGNLSVNVPVNVSVKKILFYEYKYHFKEYKLPIGL